MLNLGRPFQLGKASISPTRMPDKPGKYMAGMLLRPQADQGTWHLQSVLLSHGPEPPRRPSPLTWKLIQPGKTALIGEIREPGLLLTTGMTNLTCETGMSSNREAAWPNLGLELTWKSFRFWVVRLTWDAQELYWQCC